LVHKPKEYFVNQGCGLKGMADALVAHVMPRQTAEFSVDQGNQPGKCVFAAELHLAQQHGDFSGRVRHQNTSLALPF
jgi:hypothetical protein